MVQWTMLGNDRSETKRPHASRVPDVQWTSFRNDQAGRRDRPTKWEDTLCSMEGGLREPYYSEYIINLMTLSHGDL